MARVRAKICGITTPSDARHASEAGADAIGVVFAPGSPRRVTLDPAAAVCAAAPLVSRVALVMNAPAAEIETALGAVPLESLQFHGDEPPAECRRFGMPYIKSIALGGAARDLARELDRYHDADALLLDAHRPGERGGRGGCELAGWHQLLQARVGKPPPQPQPGFRH